MTRHFVLILLFLLLSACVVDNGSGGGQSGALATGCGSGNCAGCCASGVCQPGYDNSACGVGGQVCGFCGGATVCLSNGLCGVNPESKWLVAPISASIASSNNGSSWDGDGSPPDVVVTMICPPSSAPTSAKTGESESYSPQWATGGCITKAKYLLAEPIKFTLDDSDLAFDDSITPSLTLQIIPDDFAAGQLTLGAASGMSSITFGVYPQ